MRDFHGLADVIKHLNTSHVVCISNSSNVLITVACHTRWRAIIALSYSFMV